MLSSEETFSFCISLSDGFKKINDNLTAVHFLNVALEYVDENDEDNLKLLPKRLIAAGQPDAALDVLVAFAAKDADFNSAESRSLVGSYANARETVETKKAHGHEVLITYLRSHVERSEEHTSDLQSLMSISSAVFC